MADFIDQFFQTDHALLQINALCTGKVQEIIDQMTHTPDGSVDLVQIPGALLVQELGLALLQQLNKPAQLLQRPSQIVGHGVAERLQFLVGRIQLCRAFLHPAVQLLVQIHQFFLRAVTIRDLLGKQRNDATHHRVDNTNRPLSKQRRQQTDDANESRARPSQ